jgi:hypothetical protein
MNDDQLTRLLRHIDEPTPSNPVFADRLFEQLIRETWRSRASHAGLLLVAAMILLATLAVGMAVGTGVLNVPWLSVDQTPPATPIALATGSGAPSATVASSATATPNLSVAPSSSSVAIAPFVTPPPGRLPPGSTATAIVDAIRVHSQPSISAPVIATISKGETVTVLHDIESPLPVGQDGLLWYEVTTASGPNVAGWVAEADNQNGYFFELAPDDSCGDLQPSVVTLAKLVESGPWHRLACLGSTPVTLTGVIDFHCQGGARGGTYEPAWLADWCPTQTITPEETVLRSFAPDVAFPGTLDMVSAPGGPSVQPRGTIVRVTGHFDDPAAATCVIESTTYRDAGWDGVWDGAAELLCREQFVVTSIETIGFMELPPEG